MERPIGTALAPAFALTGLFVTLGTGCSSGDSALDASAPSVEFVAAGGSVEPDTQPAGSFNTGVTIVRDGEGVPHVFAADFLDVFRGAGWAHARDRLFQMDFSRRFTEGRLSELFWEDPGSPPDPTIEANNAKLLAFDADMRTYSFAHHNGEVLATLHPVYQNVLRAYADGVNTFLNRAAFQLPPMYSSLGFPDTYEIESWNEVDCLNVWDRISLLFEPGNLLTEIVNLNDLRSLGYIPCDCSEPRPIDESGAIVAEPFGGMWPTVCDELFPGPDLGRGAVQELQFVASHTFALSPAKSTTEGPMLFGDPKIPVSAPSIFYPFHIAQTGTSAGGPNEAQLNVQGIGFPGAPGMVIFWNDFLSQTVTSAGGDLWDLFELTPVACSVDADAGSECYLRGAQGGPTLSRALDERTEVIETRFGGPSTVITVKTSVHGPIVNDILVELWSKVWPPQPLPAFLDESSPAFRWYALEHAETRRSGMHSLVASLEAMQSQTLERYMLAMGDWVGPVVHAVFAVVDSGLANDSQGSIGYVYAAGVPCRPNRIVPTCSNSASSTADMRGRLPYNGSNSSVDWGPLLSALQRPHVVDPPEGYVFAGNNLAAGDWYNSEIYTGQRGAGDTYRSMILRRKLAEHFQLNSVMTPQQAWDLHSDATSIPAEIYTDLLQRIALLDDSGEFVQAPDPPDGPAVTDSEKAFKTLLALQCWADGSYDQSSPYGDLIEEVLIGLVREGRYDIFDPNANSSKMSCKWNEGQGGACFVLKAFASAPNLIRLYENDGTTPTIEVVYAVDIAVAAWERMKALGFGDQPCKWPDGPVEDYLVPYQLNYFCPQASSGNCELGELQPGQEIVASLDKRYSDTLNSAAASAYPSLILYATGDNTNLGYFPCGLHEDPESPLFVNPDVLALWEADSRCELTLDGPIRLPDNPLDPDQVLVQPDTGGRIDLEFGLQRKHEAPPNRSNAAGAGTTTSGTASRR